MTRFSLTLAAGLALAPVMASARPGDAGAALRAHVQALHAGGFPGMAAAQVPQAPAEAIAVPTSAQADETAEALAALSRASQKSESMVDETARALGFDLNGGKLMVNSIERQPFANGIRVFSVATIRGKTGIVIQEFNKPKQELRSYLITSDGSLEAAAVTKKMNGKFQAEKIAVSGAQAGCSELLEFWMRYYHENLKTP